MKLSDHRCDLVAFVIVGGLLGLVSCSSPPEQPVRGPRVVWPPPPAQPRIQHVLNASRPSELGASSGGFSRFLAALTGSEKGNEPFEKPFGVGLDEKENLVLGDTDAATVGFLDQEKRRWRVWRTIGGKSFQSPVAVAKRRDVIYVADSGAGEVVAFDLNGDLKRRFREKLRRPCGLAFRGPQLMVADSQLHSVLAFGMDGRLEGQIGHRGSGPGELNFPTHLAVDSAGQLYVSDAMNKRIQVFDREGKFVRQIGGPGDSPGYFGCPKGIAVDPEGNVFVMDAVYDCLQIFNPEGKLLLSIGQTGVAPGEFWLPNGIAVSSNNRVYVADAHNRRVQVFSQLKEP